MTNLAQRIAQMDDFTVVRALEHVNSTLLERLESEPSELLSNVPTVVSQDANFANLVQALERDLPLSMPAELSVKVARQALSLLAARPELAPLVEEGLSSYKDDRAMVGEILSSGAAISMIIVAATTTLRFKGSNLTVVKEAASPELLGAITELIKGVASALGGTAAAKN